jgi:hypothetical protein
VGLVDLNIEVQEPRCFTPQDLFDEGSFADLPGTEYQNHLVTGKGLAKIIFSLSFNVHDIHYERLFCT